MLACTREEAAPVESTRRPNIVFIVVDTLRADAIDDGGDRVATPEIDGLAAEGIPFPRAYSHAPMTLPSHTSLFSSRIPLEHGVLNNGQPVPENLPLLAEWLSRYGYSSHAVVSLGTLLPAAKTNGLRRGFEVYDRNFFMMDKGEHTLSRLEEHLAAWPAFNGAEDKPFFLFAHFSDPHEPYRSHQPAADDVRVTLDGDVVGELLVDDAPYLRLDRPLEPGQHEVVVEGIGGRRKFKVRALFVRSPKHKRIKVDTPVGELRALTDRFVATFEVPETSTKVSGAEAPGAANPAGETSATKQQPGLHRIDLWLQGNPGREEATRRYLAEVEHVDQFIGRLLQVLRSTETYDNTIVVFVSDHGECLGERDFMGHVRYLNEPLLRVPLIIKPARGGDARARLEARAAGPVSLIDIAPTVLEMAGLPPLPGSRGISLLGDRTSIAFEHIAETHKPEAPQDRVSFFDGQLRMVYVLDEDRYYLYDLSSDPGEKLDVFAERSGERPEWPARLKSLAERGLDITTNGAVVDDDHADLLDALGY